MRFVLLVEGYTEEVALGPFLKKWLDNRLNRPVRVKPVRHKGWSQLVSDLPTRVEELLSASTSNDNLAGIIALMDLYGPNFFPKDKKSSIQRFEWGRDHFEKQINDRRFRMFFAVHEIEAWLLSDPGLFPREVRKGLPAKISKPEDVNFNEPPSMLLKRLYKKLGPGRSEYNKVADGAALFAKLNPEVAYEKCPYLKIMLDEMLELAKAAGN